MMARVLDTPLDALANVLQGNVVAQLQLVQRVLPGMLARGRGAIVNLVSASGAMDPPAPTGEGGWGFAYSASKAAFMRLTGVLAVEHKGRGVRFFDVEPGFVLTELMQQSQLRAGFAEQWGGAPPQVPAAVIAWLLTRPRRRRLARPQGLRAEALQGARARAGVADEARLAAPAQPGESRPRGRPAPAASPGRTSPTSSLCLPYDGARAPLNRTGSQERARYAMGRVRLACCSWLAGLFLLSSPVHGISMDELVDGDFSGNRSQPSDYVLGPGSNSLLGKTVGGDLDYVSVRVLPGMTLDSMTLVSYASNDSTAFIAIQSGAVFTEPPSGTNIAKLLGYTHIGPGAGNVGTDILDDLGVGPGAIGFHPPLSEGTYTFWIQQLGATTSYHFDLFVMPEPSSEAMLAAGCAALAMLERTRRRRGLAVIAAPRHPVR